MDYILPALGLVAGFHAYTYAKWLKQHNNRPGALAVMLLAGAGAALPLYRYFSAP